MAKIRFITLPGGTIQRSKGRYGRDQGHKRCLAAAKREARWGLRAKLRAQSAEEGGNQDD